jgi:hypothetical protein
MKHGGINLSVKRFEQSSKDEQEPRAALLGPTELVPAEDKIHFPKHCVLNKKKDN